MFLEFSKIGMISENKLREETAVHTAHVPEPSQKSFLLDDMD